MKTSVSLTDLLCRIKDKRRKQGTRHSIEAILLTVILAFMSDCRSYRSVEDFCTRYKDDLLHVLGYPKHGVASYSSIRRVLMGLDFDELSALFSHWIFERVKIRKHEWLQVDGKCIKGTMSHYNSKSQNFTSIVSLFMNRTGLTLKAYHLENLDRSEIVVVEQLIEELELKRVVISMDALHCQKKHWLPSAGPATITWSR
jgi:hypothetical protein